MKKYFLLVSAFSITTSFGMQSAKNNPLVAAILGYRLTQDVIQAHRTIINEQNNLGWTALHFAASSGDKITMDILREHGANDTIQNNEGKTAQELFEEHKKIGERCECHIYVDRYDQSSAWATETNETSEQQANDEQPTALQVVYNPLAIGDLSPLQKDIKTNSPSYASLLR